MAATTRDSVTYKKLHTDKYVGKATERGGRMFPIPFEHTVVSGEVGGASAGTQDKVNLCVIPANAMVVDLALASDNVWGSAGVNGTFQLGDSGDDDRYSVAVESYSTNGPIATEKAYDGLAVTGQNYTPTADTIVVLVWKTANPTVGKKVKGCFFVVLAE